MPSESSWRVRAGYERELRGDFPKGGTRQRWGASVPTSHPCPRLPGASPWPVRWLPPAPLPRPLTVTPPRRQQVGGPCVSGDQDPAGSIFTALAAAGTRTAGGLARAGMGSLEAGPGEASPGREVSHQGSIKGTRAGAEPRGPPGQKGLGSPGLGGVTDLCLPVSPTLHCHLSCHLPHHHPLCRAVSQAPPLKVKLSRSDPALSACLVGRGWEWAGGWADSSLSLCHLCLIHTSLGV